MATNTAQTQAHGGAKPAFPPFQKETFASQIDLARDLLSSLLYLLMSRVALPRVGGDHRRARSGTDRRRSRRGATG